MGFVHTLLVRCGAMAVSARSAKKNSSTASCEAGLLVDMRSGGRAVAGSFYYEGDRLVTGWHRHDLDEIEYALQGAVEVETVVARYFLPPQQAAWIPAGLDHDTTINTAFGASRCSSNPGWSPILGIGLAFWP